MDTDRHSDDGDDDSRQRAQEQDLDGVRGQASQVARQEVSQVEGVDRALVGEAADLLGPDDPAEGLEGAVAVQRVVGDVDFEVAREVSLVDTDGGVDVYGEQAVVGEREVL